MKAWIYKFDKDFPVFTSVEMEEEEFDENKSLEENEVQSKPISKAASRTGSFKSTSMLSLGSDDVDDNIQALFDNLMYHTPL